MNAARTIRETHSLSTTAPPPPPTTTTTTTDYVAPGLGRVVLVVDDDGTQLTLVKLQLENAGFVVEVARTPSDALVKALTVKRVDAILSDVLMDDVDGFRLCAQLRSEPSLARVPIVLMSAHFRDKADRALARKVGAEALVLRTPNLQEGIEALVCVLASTPSHEATIQPPSMAPAVTELHRHRLTRQLAALDRRSAAAETEQALGIQKLEASERKYRSLIENVPDIVWSSKLDGTLTFISPNVERFTGFTSTEILEQRARGTSRFERVHPADVERVRLAWDGIEKGGATTIDVEYRWMVRDNSWRSIHARGRRVRDEDGDCIQGLFIDVTERRALEEQLLHSQKLEAVGEQLTAGVAHDFNNILAIVLSSAELLAQTLKEDDPRRVDVDDIRVAAERAANLTKQLLVFSRRNKAADLQAVDGGKEGPTFTTTPAIKENTTPRKTICLVDDDDAVRVIVQRILRRRGFDVISAANESDAVVAVTRNEGKVDLILSDVNVPGSSGVAITKRLLELHPDAMVLFISGCPPTKELEAMMQIDRGVKLLEKPFATQRLVATITKMLA